MPHLDTSPSKKKDRLHSWICMIPLMKEGSWVYVYDEEFKYKLLRIPLGSYLVIRDDVYHGGFCGTSGNVRMQITLIPKSDIGKFQWLSHANKKVAEKQGFYHPKPVDYGESVNILDKFFTDQLKKQSDELAKDYLEIDSLYRPM